MPDQQLENIIDATDIEAWLAEKARRVRVFLVQSTVWIVRAGNELSEVKANIPHGQWMSWVADEFDFSLRTAERLISVYEMINRFQIEDHDHITKSGLYTLAESSTPPEVQQDLLGRSQMGIFFTRNIVNGVTDAFLNFMESMDDLQEANDRVFGMAIQHDVSPKVIPMLSRIEAEMPEVFGEIEASGCIENYDGDAIPISEANERDFASFVDHNRFEKQQRAIAHKMNERVTIFITLPEERPMSLNKFYGRSHWSVRDKEKERVAWVMEEAIRHQWMVDYAIIDQPCRITATVYFKARPYDASNIAIKPYEDALKGKLIVDDDWRHVTDVTLRTRMDRDRPRMEIKLEFE